jgi:hypothetical protein
MGDEELVRDVQIAQVRANSKPALPAISRPEGFHGFLCQAIGSRSLDERRLRFGR